MDRDKILTELFNSKDLAICIAKMDHRHLHNELKSELFLVLSQLSEEKIVGMWERKELNYFIFATIRNMVNSSTSKFHRDFRQSGLKCYPVVYNGYELAEDPQVFSERKKTEEQNDQEVAELITVIDSLYWYDREVMKLYLKLQSVRKVAKQLNIPPSSIYETISRCKKTIRKQLG